ncbi:hypothetical protein [Agarilytica rhodophyticola]|uniref:hypothetical protein n=1 Tax=Agarilytica rhodophyticola TaxID=1737490 RepID=UPI000B344006|nr:hypothetical protein [Agarilytica rhodophyticola]
MKTIYLHGALSSLIENGELNIDVVSPLDALRFLSSVLPGFKKEILRAPYFLSLNKSERLCIDHYGVRFGNRSNLHILPDVSGAKVGGAAAGIAPESSAYESRDDENVSALFNGGVNTTEQGICVPVVYGEVGRAGSAVISAGISVEEIPYTVPIDEPDIIDWPNHRDPRWPYRHEP